MGPVRDLAAVAVNGSLPERSARDARVPAACDVVQRAAAYIPGNKANNYGTLVDDTTALGPGKNFTQKVRQDVITTNSTIATLSNQFQDMQKAFSLAGISEHSHTPVAPLKDFKADVTEIDHIYPKEKDGANSVRNAQVLAGSENLAKSDNYPWGAYSGARLLVTDAVDDQPSINTGDTFPIAGSGPNAVVDFSEAGVQDMTIAQARTQGLAPPKNPV